VTRHGWPRYSRLLPTASAAGSCSVSNVWGSNLTDQRFHQQPPRLLQLSAVLHSWHPAPASTVGAKCWQLAHDAASTSRRCWGHSTGCQFASDQRITLKVATIVHKCLNGRAPVYLSSDLQYTSQRRTGMRSASAALLEVPRSWTAIGGWSFSIAGPWIWNTLPASVRDTNSSLRFRKLLKAFLFVWRGHGAGGVELAPLNGLT